MFMKDYRGLGAQRHYRIIANNDSGLFAQGDDREGRLRDILTDAFIIVRLIMAPHGVAVEEVEARGLLQSNPILIQMGRGH